MTNPYLKQAALTGPVEIIAILDRSGSMTAIQLEAIGGFNKFLADQQAAPGEATMTLVLFDDHYEVPVQDTPVKSVAPLTMETFVPRGMTALNDAIGRTLTSLVARSPERAIVVILTDGMENASREFQQPQVKSLIEQVRAKGYQVVYLAANQDAFQVGAGLGVLRSATANFAATGAGVTKAYNMASSTTLDYRSGGSGDLAEHK